MAFLDKTGLQTLTNKLVQGDAIKVASHRGKNVKEVIDNIQRECENVALPNTMTLENRVNEFKVGQGRDINVSNDIEESKIELKLKGQTYHNLCKSNCDISCQYPSNFNIETYSDRIVVTRINENNSGWAYCRNNTLKTKMLKPSTVYTLFFKYETNFTNVPRVQFVQGNALQYLSDAYNVTKIKDNIYMCKITTLSSFDNKEIGAQILYFHNTAPYKTGNKITLYKDMILLEGDYTQTPIEELPKYFNGIKSSFENGVVDVEVQGKNLFDCDRELTNYGSTSYEKIPNGYRIKRDTPGRYSNSYIVMNLKPNTKYLIHSKYTLRTGSAMIIIKDKNNDSFPNRQEPVMLNNMVGSFVTPDDGVVRLGFACTTNTETVGDVDFYDILLQEYVKSSYSPYEPYYKKKISFNIGESLRSLPNGVCDEIRNNNGQWELVRKVGQKTLNGTENWSIAVKEEDYNTMYLNVSDIGNAKIYVDPSTIPNIMCDTLPVTSYNTAYYMSSDSSLMCITNRNNKASQSIAIRMLNNTNTAKVLTDWLSKNPITVYYELATYIVTPIDPIEFNISQGATVSINSDISPVSTYDAVLNRAGQIEQGISLIADLRNRVNTLESIYDSNLIATQYKLDNLKLNYELEREED